MDLTASKVRTIISDAQQDWEISECIGKRGEHWRDVASDAIAQAHRKEVMEMKNRLAVQVGDTIGLEETVAELKGEMGKAQDLLGAAYGLLKRAQEEEGDGQEDTHNPNLD